MTCSKNEIHFQLGRALYQIRVGAVDTAIATLLGLRRNLEEGMAVEDVSTAPARSTDPETSKAAAKTVSPTNHLGLLLRAFHDHEHISDREAISVADLRHTASPWKRCSELRSAGLIEVTGTTEDPTTHRMVQVHALTPAGHREYERLTTPYEEGQG